MSDKNPNDQHSEEWFRLLKESHNRSEEFGLQSSHALDKSLLALSGGAIGVSLTFLDSIQGVGCAIYLLYASWVGFVVCIYFTIRSMREAADRLAEETTFYNLVFVPELGGTLSDEDIEERDRALRDSKELLERSRHSNRWGSSPGAPVKVDTARPRSHAVCT